MNFLLRLQVVQKYPKYEWLGKVRTSPIQKYMNTEKYVNFMKKLSDTILGEFISIEGCPKNEINNLLIVTWMGRKKLWQVDQFGNARLHNNDISLTRCHERGVKKSPQKIRHSQLCQHKIKILIARGHPHQNKITTIEWWVVVQPKIKALKSRCLDNRHLENVKKTFRILKYSFWGMNFASLLSAVWIRDKMPGLLRNEYCKKGSHL